MGRAEKRLLLPQAQSSTVRQFLQRRQAIPVAAISQVQTSYLLLTLATAYTPRAYFRLPLAGSCSSGGGGGGDSLCVCASASASVTVRTIRLRAINRAIGAAANRLPNRLHFASAARWLSQRLARARLARSYFS